MLGLGLEDTPKEVEKMHCKHLESRLDQLTLAMTSLMERLKSNGIGWDIEYKEELVHHMLVLA